MSKTWKERPDKYRSENKKKNYRPKEDRRFESTKGRSKDHLRNEIYNIDNISSTRGT